MLPQLRWLSHCAASLSAASSSPSSPPPSPPPPPSVPIISRIYPPERIRNFSIIAHIDHGKSTLADRLLEYTGTINASANNKQFLDRLQVEQERGITVKSQTATLFYDEYMLNLIDTPGHVDFSYEVSCALAACQGCLLLVDAVQGVQAQTVANFFAAFERDLTIIPIVNKVDLISANVDMVVEQMERAFDFRREDMLFVSAKTGLNIEQILPAVIARIKPPPARPERPFKGLLVDSWYNAYRGVVSLVQIRDGALAAGQRVACCSTGRAYEVSEVGILHPNQEATPQLTAGQVGYVVTGMKEAKEARVGDTLYHVGQPVEPVPDFKPAKPMVFAGVYPFDQGDYELLNTSIDKLTLNDASVSVQRDVSEALGPGWRLGFLGMLHMDVFSQRLEQEYGAQMIVTSPSVSYIFRMRDGSEVVVEGAAQYPDPSNIVEMLEPMTRSTIIVPEQHLGKVIDLCQKRRGVQEDLSFLDSSRVMLVYRLPLNELIEDFYDKLKSISSGYASFDYEEIGYEPARLTKLQILINSEPVDALSLVVHRDSAYPRGKELCRRLRENIPRQLVEVAIQAAAGSKIIARETIKAWRKDVTAKCDISRKLKLLKRQREGKKKMRMVANVELPREAFVNAFRRDPAS